MQFRSEICVEVDKICDFFTCDSVSHRISLLDFYIFVLLKGNKMVYFIEILDFIYNTVLLLSESGE